jgi:hypothetical protein
MATKGGKTHQRDKAQPPKWKGDEVEDAAEGEAERAADRAEGHTPISLDDAVERASEDEAVGDDLPRPGRDALSPDEKTAEVAEEHRERMAAGDRGRGKL